MCVIERESVCVYLCVCVRVCDRESEIEPESRGAFSVRAFWPDPRLAVPPSAVRAPAQQATVTHKNLSTSSSLDWRKKLQLASSPPHAYYLCLTMYDQPTIYSLSTYYVLSTCYLLTMYAPGQTAGIVVLLFEHLGQVHVWPRRLLRGGRLARVRV